MGSKVGQNQNFIGSQEFLYRNVFQAILSNCGFWTPIHNYLKHISFDFFHMGEWGGGGEAE